MNKLKTGLLLFAVLTAARSVSVRDVIDFDGDWRFALGDPAGTEAVAFDDSSCLELSVPHDWANRGVKIRLNPGANRIRITTIEPGGMCIDSIEIK